MHPLFVRSSLEAAACDIVGALCCSCLKSFILEEEDLDERDSVGGLIGFAVDSLEEGDTEIGRAHV